MDDDLTLEELVQLSGMTLRTVRFYIQEGLLPGPDTRGKNARYSRQHLDRLALIQRYKELYLPLHQIRQLLAAFTPEDIARALESLGQMLGGTLSFEQEAGQPASPSSPRGSALEYIRSLQEGQARVLGNASYKIMNSQIYPQAPAAAPGKVQGREQPAPDLPQESWRRIRAADGIEVHVRLPASAAEEERVRQLIEMIQRFDGNKE